MKDKKFRYYVIKIYSVFLVFIILFIMAALVVRFTDVNPISAYLTVGIPLSLYMLLSMYLGYRGMSKYSWQGPFYDGEKAFEKGEFAKALAFYQAALKLNDEKHKLWYSYGFTLYQLKRYEEALKAYEKALSLNNTRKDSLYKNLTARSIINELAHTYRALGKFQKALDIIMECLDWFPRDDEIFRNMALFYNDLGQYQKAIGAAEKSLQLNKRGGRAFTYQGYAYLKLGELETAKKLLENAIEIDPYFARSYYNMALYYLEVNQKETALEFCEKSLQVDENFTESKELKEMLTT